MAKKLKASVWVIVKCGDEYLLLQRGKKSNNPLLWNFPGGGAEKKEGLIDTAVRELREETGIVVKRSDLVLTENIKKGFRDAKYYMVIFDKKPKVTIDHESNAYKWVTLDKFPKKLHKQTLFYVKNLDRLKRKETAGLNLRMAVEKALAA